jgi:hypothetical protein
MISALEPVPGGWRDRNSAFAAWAGKELIVNQLNLLVPVPGGRLLSRKASS